MANTQTKHLTKNERAEIARLYNSEDKPTQQELAYQYQCSPVTIRRALAEEGVLQLKGYKTENEEQIIDFLRAQGLNKLDVLQEFVAKARTGQ